MTARLTPQDQMLRQVTERQFQRQVEGVLSVNGWEVTVPAPEGWISSNQRIHRMQQAKLTKAWRLAGFIAARNAGVPTLSRAAITAFVWKPRNGRYDPGNLYPTCKAIVDGFVDAGILEDDDWKHLDGPDMRHGGKGEAAIVLQITEIPANCGIIEAGPEVLETPPGP